eukprot:scaffold13894_cov119-Skeletonema_menzelii.AAC.1
MSSCVTSHSHEGLIMFIVTKVSTYVRGRTVKYGRGAAAGGGIKQERGAERLITSCKLSEA